jgi:hypothetical protein
MTSNYEVKILHSGFVKERIYILYQEKSNWSLKDNMQVSGNIILGHLEA